MTIGGIQLSSIGQWLAQNKLKVGAVAAAGLLVFQLIPSASITAQGNLIGYWKFDEENAGATAVDSSGHGNDAAPVDDPAPDNDIPPGMGNAFDDPRSISLNGTSQYFTVANDGAFDNTDAITISAWVKFDSIGESDQTIISKWQDEVEQQWLLSLDSDGNINFVTDDGESTDNLVSNTALLANTWYHIAATATDGEKKLYINGNLDNSNTAGGMSLAGNTAVSIGARKDSEGSFSAFLGGKLDDVRVYDRVLTEGEIEDLSDAEHVTATWTGGSSTDWFTADNWDTGGVPDAYTNVVIPQTANYPILTQNATAAKVTVSAGGILHLNGFDLTTTEGGTTVVGTIISKNTETVSELDVSRGTVMYVHTGNAVGLALGNSYNNLILNDGLVGYWKLDDATPASGLADASGYGRTGTANGNPAASADTASSIKFANSRSLSLDGDDYVSVPDAPHLDITGPFTISAWVKPASLDQQMQIVAKSDENDTPAAYALYIDNTGKPAFRIHDGDDSNAVAGETALQANEWTHIAGVYDGWDMYLYVNGTEVATAPANAPAANDAPLTIGGFSDAQQFNGLIDDVRVYNRALDSSAAARLGSGEQPATSVAATTLDADLEVGVGANINNGLMGYWKLDESETNDPVLDSSGAGNNGTPFGATPDEDTPPAIPADQNPFSLNFDGDDYVTFGNVNNVGTGDFTITAWFKTSHVGSNPDDFQYLLSKRTGSRGYELGINQSGSNDGKVYIYIGDGVGGSVSNRIGTADYRDGKWHHVAVVFDRDSVASAYVDGNLISTTNISGESGSLDTANPLVFGMYYDNNNQHLRGNLDDVRIYGRTLSPQEVALLFGGDLGEGEPGKLVLNGGTLDVSASNYAVNVGGDFENNGGVFEARQGTVNLIGGNQTINSSNTFYNLAKDISSGFNEPQTLTFGSGSTTTISNNLTLTGASGAELSLVSSASGKAWNISVGGTAALSYLAVSDSNNTGATLTPANSTDGGGNTNWNLNAPDTPANLGPEDYTDGSYGTDTTPTLTFDLSDPDAGTTVGYQIQIDNDSDFSSPVVDYTSGLDAQGSFSFTVGQDTGSGSYATGSSGQTLSDGTYYWRVKAIDVGNYESAYTAANGGNAAFSVDTTGPTTPDQPSPAASPTADTTPSWSWGASTDDGAGLGSPAYTVEWSQDSDFETVTDSATTNDTTFTHTDELADGTWYLRVKAVDDLGNESDWSDVGSVLVDATAPTKPGTPTATSPTSDSTPTVSWSASNDSDSGLADPAYTLEWSADPAFDGGADGSVTTNDTSAAPGPLSDGTWYFRVTATDNVGNTNTSDISSGIIIDATSPTAPGKPTATSPTNDNTPAVSWSASNDSGVGLKDPAYTLEWSDDPAFDGGADGSVTTNDTTASPGSALADGIWYFRVIASDALDNTATSEISDGIVIDTTGPGKPGTPSTTSPTSDTTPAWTWGASTDDGAGLADPAYTVEWSQAADFSNVTGSASAASNTYTHSVALVDGTWYFRVKAEDAVGNESEWSDAGSVIVDTTGPTAPANFQLTTPSPTNVATIGFAWDASSDSGTGLADPAYTLVWCNNVDCDDETDSTTTNNTSIEVALPDGTWYVHVFATDGMGHESDNSDTVSVVVDRTGPTAPGKPTATSPTNDSTPTVSWSASSDSGVGLKDPAYTLQWSTDPSFDGGADGSVTTNNTSASPGSALTDGTWYFRVIAADALDNTTTSEVSDAVIIDTTGPTEPGTPSTTSPTSDTTPTWSWDASSDAGAGLGSPAYIVEWSQELDFDPVTDSATTDDTSFTHTDELADGTWYFRVKAQDSLGNESVWSNAGSVLIDTTAPTKPRTPTATSPTNDTTPTVSWDESTDSGSGLVNPAYTLEWSDDPEFDGGADGSTTTNNTSANPGPLPEGTWYFRVTATDNVGNASTSDISSGIVIDTTGPTAPGKPTIASPTTDNTPEASWSASADPIGLADPAYTLEWSDSATFDGGADGSVTTNNTSASPGSALADGTWYFRVIASDAVGNTTTSAISDPVLIDTTPPTKPGKPTTPSPTSETTPTWTWTPSTDSGTGLTDPTYRVEWSEDPFLILDVQSATTNDTTFTHTDELADGTWYFRVIAYDNVGLSTSSDVATVEISANAPIISNVTATPGDDPTKMVITWTTNKAASSEVRYGPTANYGTQTPETDTDPRVTSHSVTLTDLVPCSIYHFAVRSTDEFDNTGGSSDQTFITGGCAGEADVVNYTTETVDPLAGDSLSLDAIGLIIPVGFSNDIADFQIKQINTSEALDAIGSPNNLTLASNKVYDIKALIDQGNETIDSFEEAITITFSYTDPEVADLIESSLWIYRWNSGTGWQPLDDCVVDEDANTVTCTTAAFSTFALFGEEKPAEQGPEDGDEGQEPGGGSSGSSSGGNDQTGDSGGSSNNTNANQSSEDDTPVTNTSDNPAGSPTDSGNQDTDGREPAGADNEEDAPDQAATDSKRNNWWWLAILALVIVILVIAAAKRRKDSER